MASLDLDQFRDLIKKSEITCKVCGWSGHSLVGHLQEKHQLSPGQYMKRFPRELHPDARLASPVITELLRRFDRAPANTDDLAQFARQFSFGASLNVDFSGLDATLPKPKAELAPDAFVPKVDKFFEFPEAETRALMAAMVLGKNAYIEGPTGCGKTELALQIHARLGRPILRVNMRGDVTSANFIGQMRASPAKGTWYKYGALPSTMRSGLCLLVDEQDYTPPQIGAVMNSVLEGKKMLHLEDTDETITAQPGFMVMATANTGGKGDASGVYTGTEILNTAFLDRFAVKLKMGYLPAEAERDMLLRRFPTMGKGDVELMVKAANEMRVAFMQGNISHTFSTRKLIDFYELQPTLGWTAALSTVILNWLDNDDRQIVLDLFKRVGIKTP